MSLNCFPIERVYFTQEVLLPTMNRFWHPPSILITDRRLCLPSPFFYIITILDIIDFD